MASPGQTHSVEEALAQDPVPSEANEAMAPEEAAGVKDLDRGGGSSSAPNDEGPEKTLFHADELFEKGSKAIEDGDFVEAVDCLSRALEIKLGLRSATFRSFSSFSCTLRWLRESLEDEDYTNDEVDDGSGDDDEDTAEADEDESDLDLAWKMLDVARAIVEKSTGNTMEKVNILAALAEVSMERG
ncbi:hypothetical protein GW17_00006163 [Ensete ventricosum]|nr:hypothetical protein GW17_00006163 [Ensete ventricosum]